MTRSTLALAGFLVLAACKGGDDKQPGPAGAGSSAGSSAAPAGAGSGTAGSAAAPTAGSGAAGSAAGSAAPATPPLSPKIKAARCGEPCLLLTDTPLAKLLETYK